MFFITKDYFLKPLNFIFLLLLFSLVSCNGGGAGSLGGGSSSGSGTTISGVAAIGAPIANGTLTVFGKGCKVQDKTNENGEYSVDLADCGGPYLLRAEGAVGTIHSIATSNDFGKHVSITSLTELIAGRVVGSANLAVMDEEDIRKISSEITAAKINSKKNEIATLLISLLSSQELSKFDLLNSSFSANGLGIDKLLDGIEVSAKSSTDFGFKIKGSPVDLDLSMEADDIASEDDIKSIEENTKMIDTASDLLKDIKLRIDDINKYLSTDRTEERDAAIRSLFAEDFLHFGMTLPEDYFSYDSYSVTLENPVLLNFDQESNIADIWVTETRVSLDAAAASEKKLYESVSRMGALKKAIKPSTSYQVKFKKIEDKWYLYGNRIPITLDIKPIYINDNKKIFRGLNVEFNSDETEGRLIRVSHGALFIRDITSDDQGNPIVLGISSECAASSFCRSIVNISNQDVLPPIIKLLISYDGKSYDLYVPSPKGGLEQSSFPQFLNLPESSSSMCGKNDTSSFPLNVRFSIPADQNYSGGDFSGVLSDSLSLGSKLEKALDLSAELKKVFSSQIADEILSAEIVDDQSEPYSGPINVESLTIGVESVDSVGASFFTYYTCKEK